MKKRSTTLLLGAFAATALLGACGDDKKSSGGSSADDFCGRMTEFKAQMDSFDGIMNSSTAPSADDLEAAFTGLAAGIKDLQNGAPAEISDALKTEGEAIDAMVTIFASYDWDATATMSEADSQSLNELMANPAVDEANNTLKDYGTNTCGMPVES